MGAGAAYGNPRLDVVLGQQVSDGERLGSLFDSFGKTLAAVYANRTGVVIGRNEAPLVNSGDALVHIAELAPLGWVGERFSEPLTRGSSPTPNGSRSCYEEYDATWSAALHALPRGDQSSRRTTWEVPGTGGGSGNSAQLK